MYKMKHQYISGGASLAVAEKKSKKNLFILISNTYVGKDKKELDGIRKDRINIIKAFGWNESKYGELFNEKSVNAHFSRATKEKILIQKNPKESYIKSDVKDLLRFCLITNCKKDELIKEINLIKLKYDYTNIILCITGHGRNDAGLISFLTEDKEIRLSEIVSLLNTDKLLNMTILLDMCRKGEFVDETSAHQLLSDIIDKRVAVMTAGWRGESASDTKNGGYLIQAVVKSINENYEQFVKSLLSFEYTLNFIADVIMDYIEIRVVGGFKTSLKEWFRILDSKNKKDLEKKKEICKSLTSVYLNSVAREYLKKLPKKEKSFKNIFLPIICRNYEVISLSEAVVRKNPTMMKV